MEPRVGHDDAFVGQRGLGEDTGVVVAGQGSGQRVQVVELDGVDVAVGVRREAEVREPALAGEGGEHLVAVAAVVAGEA